MDIAEIIPSTCAYCSLYATSSLVEIDFYWKLKLSFIYDDFKMIFKHI